MFHELLKDIDTITFHKLKAPIKQWRTSDYKFLFEKLEPETEVWKVLVDKKFYVHHTNSNYEGGVVGRIRCPQFESKTLKECVQNITPFYKLDIFPQNKYHMQLHNCSVGVWNIKEIPEFKILGKQQNWYLPLSYIKGKYMYDPLLDAQGSFKTKQDLICHFHSYIAHNLFKLFKEQTSGDDWWKCFIKDDVNLNDVFS